MSSSGDFDAALLLIKRAIDPEYFRATWSQRNLGADRTVRLAARKRLEMAHDAAVNALEVLRVAKTMKDGQLYSSEEKVGTLSAQIDALRVSGEEATSQSVVEVEIASERHAALMNAAACEAATSLESAQRVAAEHLAAERAKLGELHSELFAARTDAMRSDSMLSAERHVATHRSESLTSEVERLREQAHAATAELLAQRTIAAAHEGRTAEALAQLQQRERDAKVALDRAAQNALESQLEIMKTQMHLAHAAETATAQSTAHALQLEATTREHALNTERVQMLHAEAHSSAEIAHAAAASLRGELAASAKKGAAHADRLGAELAAARTEARGVAETEASAQAQHAASVVELRERERAHEAEIARLCASASLAEESAVSAALALLRQSEEERRAEFATSGNVEEELQVSLSSAVAAEEEAAAARALLEKVAQAALECATELAAATKDLTDAASSSVGINLEDALAAAASARTLEAERAQLRDKDSFAKEAAASVASATSDALALMHRQRVALEELHQRGNDLEIVRDQVQNLTAANTMLEADHALSLFRVQALEQEKAAAWKQKQQQSLLASSLSPARASPGLSDSVGDSSRASGAESPSPSPSPSPSLFLSPVLDSTAASLNESGETARIEAPGVAEAAALAELEQELKRVRAAAREKIRALKAHARSCVVQLEAQLEERSEQLEGLRSDLTAAQLALSTNQTTSQETIALYATRLEKLKQGAKQKIKKMKTESKSSFAKLQKKCVLLAEREAKAVALAEAAKQERKRSAAELAAAQTELAAARHSAASETIMTIVIRDVVRRQQQQQKEGAAAEAVDTDADMAALLAHQEVEAGAGAADIAALLARRVASGAVTDEEASRLEIGWAQQEELLATGVITQDEFIHLKSKAFEGLRKGVFVETPTSSPWVGGKDADAGTGDAKLEAGETVAWETTFEEDMASSLESAFSKVKQASPQWLRKARHASSSPPPPHAAIPPSSGGDARHVIDGEDDESE